MKQSKRILAYSALALVVMLAAFGAIAFDTSNVAYAQGPVPAAPTLTAEASGATTIDLSWDAVDDAARYELWAWDSVNEWDQLDDGSLTITSHSHTGLTSGTTYYYQIRAVNSDGAAGGWSDRVNEVAGDMVPDEPVLTATAGYQQIRVSWPAVTGATRYELWAWAGSWEQLDGGSADPLIANFYVHTGLSTRTYYYQGRAVDSAGVMSAWSEQVSAEVLSTPNISAPTSFNAARGDEQVTLTWGDPSNTAGLTIAKYEYRHRESGGTFADSWTDAGNDGTETIGGLTNGTTYDFELRAVSTTDAVGYTASDSATPSTVPDAPTLAATATHNSVTLTWTAPSDDGGADITSYRIQRENDDATWTTRYNPPSSVTTWTDSGLTNGIEYTYRIFAINLAGMSDWTPISVDTLSQAPGVPSAPLNVTAAAATVDDGGGKVTLEWQAPVFNGGSAITIYQYQYRETTGGSFHPTFWRDASQETEVEVTLADDLDRGKTYTFRVRARNAIGAGPPSAETDTGATVAVTPPIGSPPLTIGRAADTTDGNDQFRLTWDVLLNTEDGDGVDTTTNVTGYTLQWKSSRYPDPDDANAVDTTDWPEDDDATRNLTSAESNGLHTAIHGTHLEANVPLLPNTTYTYRVRAISTGGSGPWSDDESMTTHVNTPSAPAAPTGAGLDSDSIEVLWMAPDDNGGDTITAYELEVRTVDATVSTPSQTETPPLAPCRLLAPNTRTTA